MRAPTRHRDLLGWLLLAGLVAAWWMLLRPASLGGPVTPVLVRGTSMEPGLSAGDLVLLRRAPPAAGAVFGVRLGPEPGTGALVVHRLVEHDGDGWTTRGDNLDEADPWRVRDDNVVGRVWVHVPDAGRVVLALGDPVVLGALTGTLTTVLLLLPAGEPRPVRVHQARRQLPLAAVALLMLAATVTVTGSSQLGTWDCPATTGPCTET